MEQGRETPRKILVVDNDEKLLSIILEYLQLCHYQVTTAATGLDALRLLRSENYHVLLTDIVMPDISGLGLIEISRKEFPGLPVIAMTGYGKQVRDLTTERSPDYYLEKPFNLNELSRVIESVLQIK
ncbi:MAG: response regulator [Deltaproteobacteria bacterium]|nr:response regulator [Deltaproteobacteria bacterium]MBW1793358.1 response regulator [Deltaproteobacteria bacterium]MBW2329851.1 response regulator [Deltaproteobacteria bacterium]